MNLRTTVFLGVVCALCGLQPGYSCAQTDRYELGLRLRACEDAWEQNARTQSRQGAIPHVQNAVTAFFTGQFSAAARALDTATSVLISGAEPDAQQLWATSLSLLPEARFVDASTPALRYTLRATYPVGPVPRRAHVRITLSLRPSDVRPVHQHVRAITRLPVQEQIQLPPLQEADYTLRYQVLVNDRILAQRALTLSAAPRLKQRLQALRQAEFPTTHTDGATVQALTRLLTGLAERQSLETDYPAARLLAEAEDALQNVKKNIPYYGQKRSGQFWLTLLHHRSAIPARLLAPETVRKGQPLPLVIALHGAGGTENLFFDGYGRGKIVRLCQQRGWLLVAPRALAGFAPVSLPDLIEAVHQLYPVDSKRIFLIGHSMGAMQAFAAVQQHPDRFAAVAAISGGGRITPAEALKKIPFFLAAGAQDFSLLATRQAHRNLQQSGVQHITYREYPDCEHLLAVQVALPDAFAFFDAHARP
ncbi:MAG: alpha/beta fold hydrolase [Chloroherpetonaceae bacterium]|nr:alpha/beta fold hydrolase [Chthonomonadaceae bacterium]MDW8206783.1 alpha/beta fold hydrolase [Chloroherpetonaceae bacterium]